MCIATKKLDIQVREFDVDTSQGLGATATLENGSFVRVALT